MQEQIFSAKTVELAVNEAAEKLGISKELVRYEIVDEGKKGLFSSKDAVIRVITGGKALRVKKFMEQIVKNFPLSEVEVSVEETDECVNISVNGEDASYLIGRRGETLNSLQYLAGLVVNNGEEKFCRVYLNINGYREKREKTLEALARRLSSQALRSGRSITLEPMAPYERRIIHSTVQGIEGVSSSSVGEEPYRKVVISSDNPRPSRGNKRDSKRAPKSDVKKTVSEDSLIKDDFLNSSSTIEGLKKERELRDSNMPLYSKVDLD